MKTVLSVFVALYVVAYIEAQTSTNLPSTPDNTTGTSTGQRECSTNADCKKDIECCVEIGGFGGFGSSRKTCRNMRERGNMCNPRYQTGDGPFRGFCPCNNTLKCERESIEVPGPFRPPISRIFRCQDSSTSSTTTTSNPFSFGFGK
uniref:Clone 701 transcribed RNA sequence n=1 Tax=Plectreurys tristis TaxID=33319 RepID=A0A0C4W5Q9_PLETR|nr:venom peptide U9-PLTX-Pt1b [Plectreurys tristis]